VKRKLRFVLVIAMTVAMSTALVRGMQEQGNHSVTNWRNFSSDRSQPQNIGREIPGL